MKKIIRLILSVLLIFTVVQTCSCSANKQYELTTTVQPAGAGSVSPGGLYDKGAKVRITATPSQGYSFEGWSGDASGTLGSQTIEMDSDKTVTANFILTGATGPTESESANPADTYTVTITVSPVGAGIVVPAGGIFNNGDSITLTAIPEPGFDYVWWSGDVSGSTETVSFIVNGNKNITAHFETNATEIPDGQYTLSTYINPEGTGIITPSGGSYAPGTTVNITGIAVDGYRFHHWSGGVNGRSPTMSVTMNSDIAVVANFEEAGALIVETNALDMFREFLPEYVCDGNNKSPEITWSGVPYGTRAFALIMDDPDAPSGDFTHWIVYNIPKDARKLEENIPLTQDPDGILQGINGYGNFGYDGPCPPQGQRHGYRFTLYALDAPLDLPVNAATKEAVLYAMAGHILEETYLTGNYQR